MPQFQERYPLFLAGAEAPAKVNLFLKVKGLLPQGKHELFSLMTKVKLFDTIEVYFLPDKENGASLDPSQGPIDPQKKPNSYKLPLASGDMLSSSLELCQLPDAQYLGENNLAIRALAAYRKVTGYPARPVLVNIIKRIPISAGLGGGSSDAGTMLWQLNNSSPNALSLKELNKIALDLGADVPFFLKPHSAAYCRGVGELIVPYVDKSPYFFVLLVNPGVSLDTARVFYEFELTKKAAGNSLTLEANSFENVSPIDPPLPAWGENDLWGASKKLCPVLEKIFKLLSSLAPGPCGLSGSGATLWGLFKDYSSAQRAQEDLLAQAGKSGFGEDKNSGAKLWTEVTSLFPPEGN